MKLRDYKFIGQTDLRRLGDWADWEEDKFITWIQNKMNLGQHIHKRFMAIYEMIMKSKRKQLKFNMRFRMSGKLSIQYLLNLRRYPLMK